MEDVNKNFEDYNPSRKCNVLIVFDVVIADTISNEKLNPNLSGLFRGSLRSAGRRGGVQNYPLLCLKLVRITPDLLRKYTERINRDYLIYKTGKTLRYKR